MYQPFSGSGGCAAHIGRGLLLGLALLAGACTTVQQAKDPLTAKPDANAGTVLLSLTLNTGEAGQFQTIYLRRDEDGSAKQTGVDRQYQLNNAVPGASRDTALFVGMLPAGTYRFASLHAVGKFLPMGDKQQELLGDFRVESGKSVDLGRLLLTAVNFNVMLGRSQSVPDNRQLVAAVADQYSRVYQAPMAGGWTQPLEKSAFIEAFARAHPQGAGGFSELGSGEVIGGSRLGSVIARDQTGRWRIAARTGQLDAILYTAPYETADSLAVAVGELGTLVKVKRDGSVAALPRGNLPLGNYIFIDAAPDRSRWFLGVQLKDEAALYETAKLEDGAWTLVRKDTVQPSFWSGMRGVWFWRHGAGVGYASTASRRVACFDYGTARWQEAGTPDDRGLIGVAGGPGPAVGVITQAGGGFAGVFAKTHYSKDCGTHWIETNSPYKVKVSAPVVLPSGHLLEGGGTFGDKGIYRSVDGTSWSKVTDDVVVFSDNLWVLPTAGLFSVSRGQYGFESIMHSGDEGSTWKTELTSLDRELLKREKADGK